MSPKELTHPKAVQRGEVPWIAALVTFIGAVVALRMCTASMDVSAVQTLPVAERETFVRAECDALRALCTQADPPPTCIDRARLLMDSGVDTGEQCSDLMQAIASHRF